jgi:hypothetical protein
MNFPEQTWNSLASSVSDTFRLTAEERKSFEACKTARLIGTLPYLAACEEAERTALTHLSVYVTAIRGGRAAFDHCERDNTDVLARLQHLMHFRGGDPTAIEHGMNLLALTMLGGYHRDRQKDAASGEYNPLNAGHWNYEELASELSSRIEKNSHATLANLMTPEEALRNLWN